ncbi:MAG TPA: response regulator [Candidatus Binatia bacterium]|nr:response regulator [Candidatus Binatia bacterium]
MKKRILLVEDNEATVEVMVLQIKFLGYDIIVARNGADALELLAKELPDLIIMDIQMPKMDGFQAVSRIKNDARTQSIPVLAATAKAMAGDKERCIASGCDGYLAKPFTHAELGSAIETCLKIPSA